MAGAGVRLFTAGNILTAQQVNEFLQDQVVCRFADAAARDASFGGLGEPTLSEGRICYLDSDNTLYLYNGSAWVEIQSGISGTSGQVVVYNSSGDPTAQTLTGDVTISSSAVTSIGTGVIVNADVNASAGIALSKLATGTVGSVVIHNASGVPTATSLTGDVTVTSTGVTSITDRTIDTKTANYTLVLTDKNKFIEMNVGSANTVSVPTDASVNFPIGAQINITQYGAGKTQVVAVTPATTSIRSTPGSYLRAQYSSATLIKRAANEWYLIGDLSAS
jgi:hypothetical protein